MTTTSNYDRPIRVKALVSIEAGSSPALPSVAQYGLNEATACRAVFAALVCSLLLKASVSLAAADDLPIVQPVPATVRQQFNLAPFYQKHIDVHGLPVVGSGKVSDFALAEAAWLIRQMLEGREDLFRAMASNRVRLAVMASSEFTTDVPEHSDLTPKAYWDRRARGLGATRQRPAVSCGEENLLGFPGDPYATENILIHEFAHAIHEMGLNSTVPEFDRELQAAYESAMQSGLWKGTYAASNRNEYWAEGVQSWFDTNRENDAVHNHVNTRAELKVYDPQLARLIADVFGDKPWRYEKPQQRAKAPHLAGFDVGKAPPFKWRDAPVDSSPHLAPAASASPKTP